MNAKKVSIAVIGDRAPELSKLSAAISQLSWDMRTFPSISEIPPREEFEADIFILTSQYNWFELSEGEKSRLGTHTFWFVPPERWGEVDSFVRERIDSSKKNSEGKEGAGGDSSSDFDLFPQELLIPESPPWEILFRIWNYIKKRDLILSLRLGVPTDESGAPLWDLYPGLDWATGLDNQSRFFRELRHYISYSRRYQRPFCCLIFSIDNYKELESLVSIEDFQLFLQDLAGWLEQNVREADLIARLAEGQFGFILPETDLEQGQVVLRRLLSRVGAFINEFYPFLKVQFSAGISRFDGEETPQALIQKAYQNRMMNGE